MKPYLLEPGTSGRCGNGIYVAYIPCRDCLSLRFGPDGEADSGILSQGRGRTPANDRGRKTVDKFYLSIDHAFNMNKVHVYAGLMLDAAAETLCAHHFRKDGWHDPIAVLNAS